MKRLQILTSITLFIGIGVFLLTILDFFALHDIYKDYVSREVFSYLNVTLPDLPNWTSTAGEWTTVGVSYGARFVFLILNMYVLMRLMRQFGKLQAERKNA